MKYSLKILLSILIGFALFQNCKKESNDQPRFDFNADLLIKRLICYPNDSISVSFEVSPKDGNGPYSYKWLMPDTLKGSGPFVVNLVENLKILVTIKDVNSKRLDFSYIIKKDTIDSLKYDYRNDVIGSYVCDFDHSWPQLINSEWQIIHKQSRDTLRIFKSNIFDNLICGIDVKYNFRQNSFSIDLGNEYRSGYFIADSIYYHYTRLARSWTKAKGKKINN